MHACSCTLYMRYTRTHGAHTQRVLRVSPYERIADNDEEAYDDDDPKVLVAGLFLESSRKSSRSLFSRIFSLSSSFPSRHPTRVPRYGRALKRACFERIATMILEHTRFFLRSALSSSALVRALFPAFPRPVFFYGRTFSFSFSLCVSRTSRSLVSIYTCSTGPSKVFFFFI